MESKLTRFFKVTIGIVVILLLGVLGGFVTTVGASDIEHTSKCEDYGATQCSWCESGDYTVALQTTDENEMCPCGSEIVAQINQHYFIDIDNAFGYSSTLGELSFLANTNS